MAAGLLNAGANHRPAYSRLLLLPVLSAAARTASVGSPVSDNMASPGQKYDDVLTELLEGFDPPPLDRESSQEDGAVVTPEISAGKQPEQTPEEADPGKSMEEDLSTSNNPTECESSSVSFLPPGFGILIPSTFSKRGNRRKSKPKKLVVPEEEDGRSPLDGVDAADGTQNSGTTHYDCCVSPKPRRARKRKPVENFQKPYLSWKTGDMPSLMFVVPNEEMESIESTKKRRNQRKEVELQEMHWCDICDECFPSLGDLEMHQTTHIEDEPAEDFPCEECGRVFDSATELQEHQSKRHGKLRYCCDICGIEYNYQSQFHIHMRAHSGERLFACEECGKEFKHRCSLVIHQRRHVGVTPHQCQKCSKMLDTRSALVKHEKMRYCPDCNKCYTQRSFNKHLINNCVKP